MNNLNAAYNSPILINQYDYSMQPPISRSQLSTHNSDPQYWSLATGDM